MLRSLRHMKAQAWWSLTLDEGEGIVKSRPVFLSTAKQLITLHQANSSSMLPCLLYVVARVTHVCQNLFYHSPITVCAHACCGLSRLDPFYLKAFFPCLSCAVIWLGCGITFCREPEDQFERLRVPTPVDAYGGRFTVDEALC